LGPTLLVVGAAIPVTAISQASAVARIRRAPRAIVSARCGASVRRPNGVANGHIQ